MPNPFQLQTNNPALMPQNRIPPIMGSGFGNPQGFGIGSNPLGTILPQGGKTGTPTNQQPMGQNPAQQQPYVHSVQPVNPGPMPGYAPQTQLPMLGSAPYNPPQPTNQPQTFKSPPLPDQGAAGSTGTIPNQGGGGTLPAPPNQGGTTNPPPTGVPSQGTGGVIGSFFEQMQSLTPEQRQMLGMAPTQGQMMGYQSALESLPRLTALQDALTKAGIPSEDQVQVNQQIAETQKALVGLNPRRYAQTHPETVGMNQQFLEKQVAREREPITETLSQLLLQKSILGEQQQRDVMIANANVEAQQRQYQMQQTLASLFPQPKLPEGVQSEFFKAGLGLNLPPEFQLYNRALQSGQIPAGTSYPDFKLSMEPKRESHFETIGNRKVQITTDQFGNTIDRKDIGAAPTNAFNFFQNNPGQAGGLINAVQSGLLNPAKVNSRNMGFLSALYNLNPNFNAVQAEAGADFWNSTATQEKLAWANTVEKDFGTLRGLSSKVSRTSSPLINSALLKGETRIAGDADATAFVQAASRVATSLSRVLGDTGGSDFRIHLASAVLDPSFSKGSFEKILATETQLVNNMKNAMREQGGQGGQNTQNEQTMPDGSVWKDNGNGTHTRIR